MLIENHGGKILSAVSPKTGFLLAGEGAGPEKMRKAEVSGVRIIGEEDFIRWLSDSGITEPEDSR